MGRIGRWAAGADHAPISPLLSPSFQVIARTSGRCLGVVDHMYIDPRTLRVASVDLRPKGLAAAAGLDLDGARSSGRARNLPLATLCQVGDVVLVHDERALGFAPLDETAGCARLTGVDVVSSSGLPLGRVRGYAFDPDTGDLLALRYDALGAPRVPEGAMTVWEVAAADVARVTRAAVTLRPGADLDAVKVSDGLLGLALAALGSLADGGDALAGVDDAEFEAWREVHGAVFARYYGLASVPASRGELDAAMAALAGGGEPAPVRARRAPTPAPRAALPPASGRGYDDVFQAAPRRAFADALEPERPRARERAAADARSRAAPPPRRARAAPAPAARPPPPPPQDDGWLTEAEGRWGGGGEAAPAAPRQGIPIVAPRRPPPPATVRDVDGGYGGAEARWGGGEGSVAPPANPAPAPAPAPASAETDAPPAELVFEAVAEREEEAA